MGWLARALAACAAVAHLRASHAHSVQEHGEGQWAPWRVRTVAAVKPAKVVDIFGIVHHNLYVADQAAEFLKARRPGAVVVEQDAEGLGYSVRAYNELIKTGKRTVLNIWETATEIYGLDGRMRNRFVTGFDGHAIEDFSVFEAMEAVGLDPVDVIPGDLDRGAKSRFTAADEVEQAAWWQQGLKKDNIEEAWAFAERMIQEWKATDFAQDPDPPAGGQDLERRRSEYFAFFDVPINLSGMEARPRIIVAREHRMARQALASAANHVVMIVGASHLDGVEAALAAIGGESEL